MIRSTMPKAGAVAALYLILMTSVARADLTLQPERLVDTGSLYSAIFGRHIGEYNEEVEPDSPARLQDRTLRISLQSDRDPRLVGRFGMGRFGLETVISGRRSTHIDGHANYSLSELDLDGDGIFETQKQEFFELDSKDLTLDHRQDLFFAGSVSVSNWTIKLTADFQRARTRGSPKGSLLYWPIPVSTVGHYASYTTETLDLTRNTTVSGQKDIRSSTDIFNEELWGLGAVVSWRGKLYLRLGGSFALENVDHIAESNHSVTEETTGIRASQSVSEQFTDLTNYRQIGMLAEAYYPWRIGVGTRFRLLNRSQTGAPDSRRRGAIKEDLIGLSPGLLTVNRDRIYEWTDTTVDPYSATAWALESWIKTEPFGMSQVGEWLFGFRYDKRTASLHIREQLESTIRDIVDNGNGIDDAGDLFKKGSGKTVFERTEKWSGETFTLWSRLGSTVMEESFLALHVQTGYDWNRYHLTRSRSSQEPVVGTITTQVGTHDQFQEPSAFKNLPTHKEIVRGAFFANIGGYFLWQPVEPLGLAIFLELNPLAGTGSQIDANATADWLSRFAAEARYRF